MNPIKSIIPISDSEAARMMNDGAFADLAEQIMSDPVPENGAGRQAAGRKASARRRWLIGIPVAAGLAAAMSAAAVIFQLGPGGAGVAQALTFAKHGRWMDVTVRDAYANPQVYRAEFRAHGLKVKLLLQPASPSAVGKLDGYAQSTSDSRVRPLTAKNCHPGSNCDIGFKIPLDYHGWAALIIGRPARPGEKYDIAGSATAPGEILHGLRVKGQTVATVLAMLHRRHGTVARFNYESTYNDKFLPASKVPGRWFVYDVVPWAPWQVMLMVGPTRTIQPAPSHRHPAATPSSSPSAAVPGSSPSAAAPSSGPGAAVPNSSASAAVPSP
jgi:hypothetical protein